MHDELLANFSAFVDTLEVPLPPDEQLTAIVHFQRRLEDAAQAELGERGEERGEPSLLTPLGLR